MKQVKYGAHAWMMSSCTCGWISDQRAVKILCDGNTGMEECDKTDGQMFDVYCQGESKVKVVVAFKVAVKVATLFGFAES